MSGMDHSFESSERGSGILMGAGFIPVFVKGQSYVIPEPGSLPGGYPCTRGAPAPVAVLYESGDFRLINHGVPQIDEYHDKLRKVLELPEDPNCHPPVKVGDAIHLELLE